MLSESLKSSLILTLLLAAIAFTVGCGSDNSTVQSLKLMPGDTGTSVDQVLNFKAMLGDEPYICGQTYRNIGTQMSDFTAKDFRLYVLIRRFDFYISR